MNTLDEAKEYLKENWQNGVECPCCKQLVKLYSVKLNASMIRSLIELYKLNSSKPSSYFHISDFDAWTQGYAGGKFAKVKYWGLAEDMPNTDETKRTSGMWRITDKGRNFVEGTTSVPSHSKLYNRGFYGHEGHLVNIHDVKGINFNYAELMSHNT